MAFEEFGIRVIVQGISAFKSDVSSAQQSLGGLERSIRTVSGVSAGIGKDLQTVARSVGQIGATMTAAVTLPLAAAMAGLVNAGIEFQNAFAGVSKTIDGIADSTGHLTEEGLELRQEFIELSRTIPVSAEQLAALGQLAGQFGETRETVLDMVTVLAMLQETTDLIGESAQQQFAQTAQVAGVAADEYDNFASALVFLGNHFPTTESRIIAFTERIVGTGTALGISIDQLLGWGAAVTSSGIQAETGATAIRKAFLEMSLAVTTATGGMVDNSQAMADAEDRIKKYGQQIAVTAQKQQEYTDRTRESTKMADAFRLDNLNADLAEQQALLEGLGELQGKVFQSGSAELQGFARAVNTAFESSGQSVQEFADQYGILPDLLADGSISGNDFAKIFRENASGALQLFIQGLSQLDAIDQIALLDDLGLSAQRVGSTLQNLAVNQDVLNEALLGAALAYEEGIALQEEFTKRTATVQAEISKLKNQFVALGIQIFDLVEGDIRILIDGIGDIVDWFLRLSPEIQKQILLFAGIAASIGPVLLIISGLVSVLGGLFTAFAVLASPVGLAAVGVGLLGVALASAFAPEIAAAVSNVKDQIAELYAFLSEPPTVPNVMPTVGAGRGQAAPRDGRVVPDQVPEDEVVPPVLDRLRSLIPEITIPPEVLETIHEFQAAFMTAGVVIKAAVQGIADVISETLAPTFTAVFDSLTELLASFGLDWGDVWNAVKAGIAGAAIIIGGIIVGIIGLVVGFVNAFGSGLNSIIVMWSNLKTSIGMSVTGVTQIILGLAAILGGLVQTFIGIGQAMVGAFTGNTDLMIQAGNRIKEGLGVAFAGIIEVISGLVNVIFGTLSTISVLVIGTFSTIFATLSGFIAGATGFWGSFMTRLTGDTSNAMLSIAAWFTTAKDTIIITVGELMATIIGFFQNLYAVLVGESIVPDMVNLIIENFDMMIAVVIGAVSGFSAAVIEFIEIMKTSVLAIMTEMKLTADLIIKDFADNVSAALEAAGESVLKLKNAFQTFKNWLLNNVEHLVELIGSIAGAVAGINLEAFNSPELRIFYGFQRFGNLLDTETGAMVRQIGAIADVLSSMSPDNNVDGIVSTLNGVTAPGTGSGATTNTNNSLNIDITRAAEDDRALADMIWQRWQMAQG